METYQIISDFTNSPCLNWNNFTLQQNIKSGLLQVSEEPGVTLVAWKVKQPSWESSTLSSPSSSMPLALSSAKPSAFAVSARMGRFHIWLYFMGQSKLRGQAPNPWSRNLSSSYGGTKSQAMDIDDQSYEGWECILVHNNQFISCKR